MGDSKASFIINSQMQDYLTNIGAYFSVSRGYGVYGIVATVIVSIMLPILLSTFFMGRNKAKQRAVPVEVGGEPGFALRNVRSPHLIDVPWEGATTMAALFEQSCKKHSQERFLGSRNLISKEFISGADGRKFEKLHLGEYEWDTFEQTFARACNFASGLVKLGHDLDTRAAIFSETRKEWFIAFQVPFLF